MSTNWTAEAGYALAPIKIEAADHQVDLPRCYLLRLGGLSNLELQLGVWYKCQAKVQWLSDRNRRAIVGRY